MQLVLTLPKAVISVFSTVCLYTQLQAKVNSKQGLQWLLLPEFTHIYLMSLEDVNKQLQDAGADA